MDKVEIFINRLEKIGINIKCAMNFPWIYVDEINHKKVTERFRSDYGFTIAFIPIRIDKDLDFTDIGKIFKLLRKYCNDKP